jgi:hypothetical protein
LNTHLASAVAGAGLLALAFGAGHLSAGQRAGEPERDGVAILGEARGSGAVLRRASTFPNGSKSVLYQTMASTVTSFATVEGEQILASKITIASLSDPATERRVGAYLVTPPGNNGIVTFLTINNNRQTNDFHFDPPLPIEVGTFFGAQESALLGDYIIMIHGTDMTGATGMLAR